MAIKIVNEVSNNIDTVIDFISSISKKEPAITHRPKRILRRIALNKQLAVAMDNNKIIGWLVIESVGHNIYEIGLGYVFPDYRHKKIFSKLTRALINESSSIYLFASSYDAVTSFMAKEYGFKQTSLLEIVKISKGRFIAKRVLNPLAFIDVIKHLNSSRIRYSILLNDSHQS